MNTKISPFYVLCEFKDDNEINYGVFSSKDVIELRNTSVHQCEKRTIVHIQVDKDNTWEGMVYSFGENKPKLVNECDLMLQTTSEAAITPTSSGRQRIKPLKFVDDEEEDEVASKKTKKSQKLKTDREKKQQILNSRLASKKMLLNRIRDQKAKVDASLLMKTPLQNTKPAISFLSPGSSICKDKVVISTPTKDVIPSTGVAPLATQAPISGHKKPLEVKLKSTTSLLSSGLEHNKLSNITNKVYTNQENTKSVNSKLQSICKTCVSLNIKLMECEKELKIITSERDLVIIERDTAKQEQDTVTLERDTVQKERDLLLLQRDAAQQEIVELKSCNLLCTTTNSHLSIVKDRLTEALSVVDNMLKSQINERCEDREGVTLPPEPEVLYMSEMENTISSIFSGPIAEEQTSTLIENVAACADQINSNENIQEVCVANIYDVQDDEKEETPHKNKKNKKIKQLDVEIDFDIGFTVDNQDPCFDIDRDQLLYKHPSDELTEVMEGCKVYIPSTVRKNILSRSMNSSVVVRHCAEAVLTAEALSSCSADGSKRSGGQKRNAIHHMAKQSIFALACFVSKQRNWQMPNQTDLKKSLNNLLYEKRKK